MVDGLYRALRPLLFSLDPERAHELTLRALRMSVAFPALPVAGRPVRLLGLDFPNRFGLAAGFDKNAVAIDGEGRLGFGFLELGTVTPRPQAGNARPRVFRFAGAGAIVNRSGFPNDGVEAFAARLRAPRRYAGPVGASIGKNADTPLERAVDDYVACLRSLRELADFIVVNISSPNTAQLRDLHDPGRLEPLLTALLEERQRGGRQPPLLLKLSPDLDDHALDAVGTSVLRLGLDGLVATNTTLARTGVPAAEGVAGGLSGEPLRARALSVVRRLRATVGPGPAIIGCGGVASGADAMALRAAGADLVQCYTGLVYRGPGLVRDCAEALAEDP